jgi:hypothetical protein
MLLEEANIILLAHGSEREGCILRLTRVVRAIRANDTGVLCRIIALHDHEGLLSVNWRTQPSMTALATVVNAWEKESECSSNHYVRSQWLIGDQGDAPWPAKPGEDS